MDATFYTENLTYTFDSGGVYPVCLLAYNTNIACGDTFCFNFLVDDNWLLTLPNVFTPNSDGQNDFFSITQQDAPQNGEITVAIYNRWGALVKSEKLKVERFNPTPNTSNHRLNVWDGTTPNGKDAPDGTYFYVVTYGVSNEEVKTLKGSVTLLR